MASGDKRGAAWGALQSRGEAEDVCTLQPTGSASRETRARVHKETCTRTFRAEIR